MLYSSVAATRVCSPAASLNAATSQLPAQLTHSEHPFRPMPSFAFVHQLLAATSAIKYGAFRDSSLVIHGK